MGSLSTKAWLLCTYLGLTLLPHLLESISPPGTKNQDLKHSHWNVAPAFPLLLLGRQAPHTATELGAEDNPSGHPGWTLLPNLFVLSNLSGLSIF